MFQSLFSRRPASFDTISGPDAVAMHGRDDVVFVDVRAPDEIAHSGTAKGAVRAPLPGLANFARVDGSGKLPAVGSGTAIVVVCASGNRSGTACAMLADMGYDRLHNLSGGFAAYARAGGPTER